MGLRDYEIWGFGLVRPGALVSRIQGVGIWTSSALGQTPYSNSP